MDLGFNGLTWFDKQRHWISLHGGFEKNSLLFQWSKRTRSLLVYVVVSFPSRLRSFFLRTEPTSQQAWEIDAFTPHPFTKTIEFPSGRMRSALSLR
ncbi:hypothetical protein Peur_040127 [Populus x canadensis]